MLKQIVLHLTQRALTIVGLPAPIWPDYVDEKSVDFGQRIRDKE
jgi:hypothetical protein